MLRRKQSGKLFKGSSFLLVIPAVALSLNVGYSFPLTVRNGLYMPPVHDTAKSTSPDSLAVNPRAATIRLNKHVTGFVKTYLQKEEYFLQKIKSKSGPCFRTIENVFLKYNLPLQLKYLAVVESGLQPKAQSPAGARGLWQLMPSTAQELGLKVAGKTDERLYTYRSTVAAARYLQNLYAEFDDWLLVLAAYNGGPATVTAAMKKAGSKNFWALQRFLPAESRGHVKRFIGIHYFFEGEGSIVTQTRAEAKAWQEKMGAGLAAR
jgi:membrane-bound lytic murein transglycosylase D